MQKEKALEELGECLGLNICSIFSLTHQRCIFWALKLQTGKAIHLNAGDLLNQAKFRQTCLSQAGIITVKIKSYNWELIANEIISLAMPVNIDTWHKDTA